MSERLFGTDGIRGKVNQGAIRPQMFVRFGEALANVLSSNGRAQPTVLIGRDTRQSGLMIESAICAGLVNAGANVELVGVLPTPAIGFLTKEKGFDAGLMITASHNPPTDNGVKVFGADGFKLSGETQDQIEALIQSDQDLSVIFSEMGGITPLQTGYTEYLEFSGKTVADQRGLKTLKVCLDAANGAGYRIAHQLFSECCAEVVSSGITPDGHNINVGCGALHPEKLQAAVLEHKADIGIALDGDADRLIVVDDKGNVVDGDQLMGALALDRKASGALSGDTLVATIMSNLGLEMRLRDAGIALERTKVGDRYVVERMREAGFNVGGEQSGHIILTDYVTTGDAVISAMQILDIVARSGLPASEVLSVFEPVPQVLKNVEYGAADPLETNGVKSLIAELTEKMGDDGRIVIRKSGTEPVIRVMAEAKQSSMAEQVVDEIISEILVCGETG